MKKYFTLILLLLSTTFITAQKKEKIKGSKTVTIENKEIGAFKSIEVSDNVAVFLDKGEKNEIKMEADDNLHDAISLDLQDNILRIQTNKEVSNFKKLIVRVTYTKDLNSIITKNEATVTAIQEIQLDDISFKALDESQLFLNVNSKKFSLQADNKSKTELNLKSETAVLELSKNAELKALISSTDLKLDQYQKSKTILEGDVSNATIRLDNNSDFVGTKFTIKNADLTAESYSKCILFAVETIKISAVEKSEIELLGAPKIDLVKFDDEAKLLKIMK